MSAGASLPNFEKDLEEVPEVVGGTYLFLFVEDGLLGEDDVQEFAEALEVDNFVSTIKENREVDLETLFQILVLRLADSGRLPHEAVRRMLGEAWTN